MKHTAQKWVWKPKQIWYCVVIEDALSLSTITTNNTKRKQIFQKIDCNIWLMRFDAAVVANDFVQTIVLLYLPKGYDYILSRTQSVYWNSSKAMQELCTNVTEHYESIWIYYSIILEYKPVSSEGVLPLIHLIHTCI